MGNNYGNTELPQGAPYSEELHSPIYHLLGAGGKWKQVLLSGVWVKGVGLGNVSEGKRRTILIGWTLLPSS